MELSMLRRDTVKIIKADGSVLGPIRATVASAEEAVLVADKIDVRDGETLVRELPGGREDKYLILSADYQQGLGPVPATYILKLQKTTAIQPALPKMNTVNIHGSTGIQVGDHNIINIQQALTDLNQRIERSDASSDQKLEAQGLIKRLLSHPLVTAVIGGVAGGIPGALG